VNQSRKLPPIKPWHHWNSDRLRKEQEENSRSFDRGFRMRAFSDDERMYPSFKECFVSGVRVDDVSKRGWPVFIGVDLAGPRRPGNVLFATALEPTTMKRFPLEVLVGAWTSPETARQLAMLHGRHPNVRYIMVENNGYQQAIIDWCQANKGVAGISDFWMKLEATTTGRNKMDPRLGLPGLQVEFANKAWIVPRNTYETHPVTCPCSWCVWDREVRNHPLAPSSDLVMAMWFARQGVENYGYAAQPVSIGDLTAR
jgi:hypothetical protein